jgi:membrane protease YdiL (CAAX protease family)
MRALIRNLSPAAEFALVMFLGFGLSLLFQIWSVARHEPIAFTNRLFLWSIIWELAILGIVLWIGHLRGWSIATFGSQISWKNTGAGFLLFIVVALAMAAIDVPLTLIIHAQDRQITASGVTLPFIILLSLVNPIFEEILEAGYFIHALKRFGMWPAILASGLLRGILHMYQGTVGAIALFTFGLIFALVYWRWRQLWPLIVAHALDDFLGLLMLARNGH